MPIVVLGEISSDNLQKPRIDDLSAQCDGSTSGFYTQKPYQSGILVMWNGMTLHKESDYVENSYIENATSGFIFLSGELPILNDNLQVYYFQDMV